jgi:hypothetical protein
MSTYVRKSQPQIHYVYGFFSEWLPARDELGRVGGLRHFRVLRNGGPPGPSEVEGNKEGGGSRACPAPKRGS